MSRHVQLDPATHHDLRVDLAHAPGLGDDVMVAPTFPGEFRELQAHYPIVFHVDGARATPLALLGLRRGENLFLEATGWRTHHVPLALERGPFLIGSGAGGPSVHVDLDHPRLHTGAGEPLFLPHGGFAPHLLRMQTVLQRLNDGLTEVAPFAQALTAHALLEPFTLDVTLDDGQAHCLSGFHVVDELRLRGLSPEAIGTLHAAGHLEPVYMAIASTARFRDLIEHLRRRHAHA